MRIRKAATLLIFVVQFAGAPLVQSQAAGTALAPGVARQIDAAADRVLAATGVPSASIAIVKDGDIAYLKAYGKARLDPVLNAAPSMQYSVGSINKQFTAAAVMLLVEQGKLSLDDPISKFLPDLTRASEVTVRMVLSHTSGYQDYWPEDYVMTSMMAPVTSQHILDAWAKKPLDFDPGTKWQYSNTNYVIAGRIVEQLSGDTLVHFLEVHIFKPLNMTGVLDTDAARLPPGDPVGYYRHALGPLRPAPKEGPGWMFAAGELAMSPRDLALWNISIMNQSLLKPSSYAEMFNPVLLKDGTDSKYGLGFFVRAFNGETIYEHSGEVSGFVSENIVFPGKKMAITVLTNQDASSAASGIAAAIGDMLTGVAADQNPNEAQALTLFTSLQTGTIDRSLFTGYCNAYFNQQALDDFASSLAPLGKPAGLKQVREELRGGMTFRVFHVTFAAASHPDKLVITTYTMPDGKIEQYLVGPGS